MGGCTTTLKANSLVELLKEFAKTVECPTPETHPQYKNAIDDVVAKGEPRLSPDSITIRFRDEDGKWISLGNNGIESAIGTLYQQKEEPKENWVMFVHFDS